MKVLIADIPDEGLVLDFKEKFSGKDLSLQSPVNAHIELGKVGKEIIVQGNLKGEMEVQCSRCLKDIKKVFDIPLNLTYHPLAEAEAEKHGLQDDEMNTDFYSGDEIDLEILIEEEILLDMQMKPLCNENCRGICPKCGKDMNIESCNCMESSGDSRLEVLKKLLEKGKE